jgi:hypothetical protein
MSTAERDTLGPLYDHFEQKLIGVHAIWEIYRQLFGTDGRRKLLNRLVPDSASMIEYALGDTVILHTCRLCDPAKTGRYENVSLPALMTDVKAIAKPGDYDKLVKGKEEIDKKIADLQVHRNKRIAHIDKEYALGGKALPPLNQRIVQDALDEIVRLMGDINAWYLNKESVYTPSLRGDGDGLIHWLQYGERLMELQDDSWTCRLTDEQVIGKLRVRMLGEPT